MNSKSKKEMRFLELLKKPVKSKMEIEEIEALIPELELEYREEIKDLIAEMKNAGLKYNSVWDLVNSKKTYPLAINILLKYLSKDMSDKNKEGIIRALGVKESVGKASDPLITEYHRIPKEKENLRWIIGNSIYTIITKKDVNSILLIVKEKENGMSRQMFVEALGKIKSDKIEEELINLLDDDEVASQAIDALCKLKSKKAKEKIKLFIDHPNRELRIKAQRAFIIK